MKAKHHPRELSSFSTKAVSLSVRPCRANQMLTSNLKLSFLLPLIKETRVQRILLPFPLSLSISLFALTSWNAKNSQKSTKTRNLKEIPFNPFLFLVFKPATACDVHTSPSVALVLRALDGTEVRELEAKDRERSGAAEAKSKPIRSRP